MMPLFLERKYVNYFSSKWKLRPVEGKIWIDGPKTSILKAHGIEVFDKNNCHGNWFYLISLEDYKRFPCYISIHNEDLVRWEDGKIETFEERHMRLNYPDLHKRCYDTEPDYEYEDYKKGLEELEVEK